MNSFVKHHINDILFWFIVGPAFLLMLVIVLVYCWMY
jgi:hypothetical protein